MQSEHRDCMENRVPLLVQDPSWGSSPTVRANELRTEEHRFAANLQPPALQRMSVSTHDHEAEYDKRRRRPRLRPCKFLPLGSFLR